jgi:hypothetical protein
MSDPLDAFKDQAFYWEARRLREESSASVWASADKLIDRLTLSRSRNSVNSGCGRVRPPISRRSRQRKVRK